MYCNRWYNYSALKLTKSTFRKTYCKIINWHRGWMLRHPTLKHLLLLSWPRFRRSMKTTSRWCSGLLMRSSGMLFSTPKPGIWQELLLLCLVQVNVQTIYLISYPSILKCSSKDKMGCMRGLCWIRACYSWCLEWSSTPENWSNTHRVWTILRLLTGHICRI